eukprot:CAMPEP_0178412772 /NCGR_PEP_ID=MMETSP0689_2-20121128/22188_1 /TAXON_ID=160604 /ORGANISM="Amphidinium massartii, Strain CS-259" /LENGTH=327 /DNA_ID=CAMNT_0020034031 /DNA_START=160 /DNA_END=1140 /DNA_ORIENTATION=-
MCRQSMSQMSSSTLLASAAASRSPDILSSSGSSIDARLWRSGEDVPVVLGATWCLVMCVSSGAATPGLNPSCSAFALLSASMRSLVASALESLSSWSLQLPLETAASADSPDGCFMVRVMRALTLESAFHVSTTEVPKATVEAKRHMTEPATPRRKDSMPSAGIVIMSCSMAAMKSLSMTTWSIECAGNGHSGILWLSAADSIALKDVTFASQLCKVDIVEVTCSLHSERFPSHAEDAAMSTWSIECTGDGHSGVLWLSAADSIALKDVTFASQLCKVDIVEVTCSLHSERFPSHAEDAAMSTWSIECTGDGHSGVLWLSAADSIAL